MRLLTLALKRKVKLSKSLQNYNFYREIDILVDAKRSKLNIFSCFALRHKCIVTNHIACTHQEIDGLKHGTKYSCYKFQLQNNLIQDLV